MKTDDVRFAALSVLASVTDGSETHRRTIANRVFGTDLVGAGSTYAALGYLAQRGWVEECPYHERNYRITDEGRKQLEVQGPMREVVAS